MPKEKNRQPPQHQKQRPGRENKMKPRPKAEDKRQRGSSKLQGKVAIITGGDSGIGRAVAVAFAKEGADVSVVYLEEHRDAKETEQLVERLPLEREEVVAASNAPAHEACALEDADVLRDRVERDVERLGHFGDPRVSGSEPLEYLPAGVVGTAYSQTLAASGGAGGNAWSISAGSLPAGLTL